MFVRLWLLRVCLCEVCEYCYALIAFFFVRVFMRVCGCPIVVTYSCLHLCELCYCCYVFMICVSVCLCVRDCCLFLFVAEE